MYYREYPPQPALAAYVDCLWAAQAPVHASQHRVLPDNCVDILWQDGGQSGRTPHSAFVVGMMSSPILAPGSDARHTLAVRFKAGAAGLFLRIPLQALNDQRAEIDLLWGDSDAARLADALWERERPERQRLALIEAYLLQRLHVAQAGSSAALQAEQHAAGLIRHALTALEHSDGNLRIDDLAARLGVSRQHLAALFRQRVGLTPKMYARICRFRRATAALRHSTTPDWSELALACGYFDQSHLIHDFQQFAGTAPQRFLLSA